jgi:hypothetical protein
VPAENVTFFNMGLLNSQLSASGAVNQHEKELAEAKRRKIIASRSYTLGRIKPLDVIVFWAAL